jgi:Reverse transcriptase (RNA-dependent DNA polymerase)
MEKLIHPSQTGFMKNRHINEGFLYAQELVITTKRQNTQIALFKADIHKAFDTLSLQYLRYVLEAKGFSLEWIRWIMKAVLPEKSQVLLNSVAGKVIELRRGVRQGDPLSPYFFILAADFLPVWIDALIQQGLIEKPFPQCRQCLLYADDTLFFLQPQEQQIMLLKFFLDIYTQLSSLTVNLQKSEMLVTAASHNRVQELA